ncbi:MAG: hypothetical protein ACI9E5_000657 [Candidatus Omnitrophota bacterium]|jgi:hypothetical protein
MKRTVFTIFSLLILETTSAMACYTCFSTDESDPNNIALRYSILFLLIVVTLVLMLFAKFFLSIRKREKLLLKGD